MADIQPVKILYLHPTFTFGGAERTSLNLLTGLNKDRFKVTLVTSKKIASYFSELPLEKIIYIEDIGMGIWFGNIKNLWRDVRIVSRLLSKEKPDIAFGMMHYSSAILALAKKLFMLNVKVISSPRGPSTEYLNICFNKKSERMFLKLLFSFFCRHSDGLIVPSSGTKDDCVRYYGARGEKVAVIPNSVDVGEIQKKIREELDISFPPDFSIISTAGRLSVEKNLPFLIKAFSAMRRERKVKLLVIGDGTERRKLQEFVNSLQIGEDVYFVGYHENPYKYIAASDVFVHTCLVEGFGNAIIEAMACKVPVVATACPVGPGEIIKNNENGLLVPLDDLEGLIHAIRIILENRNMRERLSFKGFTTASHYSIERMVSSYEAFF